ncbi:MAG: transcription elongation factor GreA [Naasia sp.]|jgi:transcription elongation factor GreA|uniref:transcription elongation factor GreA n=1 Tax=Naasia sp. TaxID=2546198 RepID=UPI00260B4528|nr:transcription elongation factor GreA [Naasia sp.]MCU1569410.1 transcription elongation factor GreA [Naasia sp.]
MSPEAPVTWLTQEAFERLSAELAQLSGEGRLEIAKRIEQAREEGDLKENGGYHAAKEEQGKIEARIRQLTQLLRSAQVGQAPAAADRVGMGTVVTATIAGDESVFLVGNREIAGDSDLDVYSEQSPLGQAILGLAVGGKTTYTAPNGREISVEVRKVEPYSGQ